ncbi:hypothetical protein GOV03_04605 [Candidatus Woesearchaeota archaeon]|nr:hypothetical protein [Candidatus Woesearchaeota archaeon]
MLTEIIKSKGIYSFKHTPLGGNLAPPVLAVHPYFLIPDLRSVDEFHSDYLNNFERLISTYDGPLITLESSASLKKTAARYQHLGRTENTIFIKTFSNTPQPRRMSWDDCLAFLKQFEEPFLLVGGYFRGEYGGCLGATKGQLDRKKIKCMVLEEITFS